MNTPAPTKMNIAFANTQLSMYLFIPLIKFILLYHALLERSILLIKLQRTFYKQTDEMNKRTVLFLLGTLWAISYFLLTFFEKHKNASVARFIYLE